MQTNPLQFCDPKPEMLKAAGIEDRLDVVQFLVLECDTSLVDITMLRVDHSEITYPNTLKTWRASCLRW